MDNEDMMETFEVTSISDHSVFGKAQNSMLRPQTTVSSSLENIDQAPAGMSRLPAEASFSKQDFEVGVDSRQPGDLVELRY